MKSRLKNFFVHYFFIVFCLFFFQNFVFAGNKNEAFTGAVDKITWNASSQALQMVGWVANQQLDVLPEGFNVQVDGVRYNIKKWDPVLRPDVDKHLGRVSASANKPLGWSFSIPLDKNLVPKKNKKVDVVILAIYKGVEFNFTSLQKVEIYQEKLVLQGAIDKVDWSPTSKALHVVGWLVNMGFDAAPKAFNVRINGIDNAVKKWDTIPRPDFDKHLGYTSIRSTGWDFSIPIENNTIMHSENKPTHVEVSVLYDEDFVIFAPSQKIDYPEEPNHLLRWFFMFFGIGIFIYVFKRFILYFSKYRINSSDGILYYHSRWSLWMVFLALVMGFTISSLISPFQSPDEHSHLVRAYAISQGDFLLVTPPNASSGNLLDNNFKKYIEPYWDISKPISRTTISDTTSHWSHEKVFSDVAAGTGYYLPIIYFPHALSLMVGNLLDWTIADTYRFTRFVIFLSALIIIWAAIRIYTPPPLALALVLLPMTTFQLLSPTIDGLSAALTLLIASLFFALLNGRLDARRESASWWLTVCIVILASCRTHALPLLGMLFYLAWWQKGKTAWIRAFFASFFVVGWVLFAMSHTKDTRIALHAPTSSLLVYYVKQPWEFFKVIDNTLYTPAILDSYINSFIGVLGWLNLPLDKPIYYTILIIGLFVAGIFSVVCVRDNKYPWLKWGLFGTAVCSVLMVFLALLITWTPHPAETIQGVQGRYFLLPAMVLAYALDDPSRSPMLTRWQWRVVSGFGLCSLTILLVTVLLGYQ